MEEIRIAKEQKERIPILIPVMSGIENDTLTEKSGCIISVFQAVVLSRNIFADILHAQLAAHLFPSDQLVSPDDHTLLHNNPLFYSIKNSSPTSSVLCTIFFLRVLSSNSCFSLKKESHHILTSRCSKLSCCRAILDLKLLHVSPDPQHAEY